MEWSEGDILFQDLQCGEVCDAIDEVTRGYRGARLDHCGIFYRDAQGAGVVVEAIPPRVVATPLDAFLRRSKDAKGRPCVMVGRVVPVYAQLAPAAVTYSWSCIGRNYDKYFAENDTALYCSELIVYSYAHANNGKKIFSEYPMTFKDPITGEVSKIWYEYFEKLGVAVPEGRIGSNPGALSRDVNVAIHTQLGDIRGAPAL